MDEKESSNVGLVACVHFIKRGVAKANPEKVQLTEEELQAIIQQTSSDLKNAEENDDSEDEENAMETDEPKEAPNTSGNSDDEFNFQDYDTEEADPSKLLALGSLATYTTDGGLNANVDLDGPDSDEEDDIIKSTDNLILVGHIQGDASILEVYVYNEEEGSLYVHHDTLLPSFPLCFEWLNRDPSDDKPGNLCAIGSMEPVIQVWDLDILNCLEPAFKLGKKKNRRKKIKGVGHKDAVMDLSWNKHLDHILASGSVDKTVLLWDLDAGQPHTTISIFEDKVQSLQWHPLESQSLLSGSSDKKSRVSDCRTDDAHKSWSHSAEVEKICWDSLKPFCFAAGTMDGYVSYVDCRQDEPLWKLKAHDDEITGLSLSSQCPDLLVTASNEGNMKIWDLSQSSPELVAEKALGIGATQCLSVCPENPFVFAAGGDFKAKNFGVWDITKLEPVQMRFGNRQQVEMSVDK